MNISTIYFVFTHKKEHKPEELSIFRLMPFSGLLLKASLSINCINSAGNKLIKPLPTILFFVCFHLSLLFIALPSKAQPIPDWWKQTHQYDENLDWADYMTYTPAYFGPNALPVPELYDGVIGKNHQLEFSGNLFWGPGEQTQSLSTRLSYVFIPGRLSLSAWGVLGEHYRTSPEIRDQRASLIKEAEELVFIGDFYLATQFRVLEEKRYTPEILGEIVLKTASSSRSRGARFFDTPGYYFDLSFAKDLYSSQATLLKNIRLVAMGGFLCYQMNNNYQNDAPLYAAKLKLNFGALSWENGLGGYCGWTGKGDCPLVLRSRLDFMRGRNQVFVQYQAGLNDYIAHCLQAGWIFTFGQ